MAVGSIGKFDTQSRSSPINRGAGGIASRNKRRWEWTQKTLKDFCQGYVLQGFWQEQVLHLIAVIRKVAAAEVVMRVPAAPKRSIGQPRETANPIPTRQARIRQTSEAMRTLRGSNRPSWIFRLPPVNGER